MYKITKAIFLLVSILNSYAIHADPWFTLATRGSEDLTGEVRASTYHLLGVDEAYINKLYEGMTTIILPLPIGGRVTYVLEPYDLLPEDLKKKYPLQLTFKGWRLGNPVDTGRFDVGGNGLNGMFTYNGNVIFLDAIENGDYAAYYQRDSINRQKTPMDRLITNQSNLFSREINKAKDLTSSPKENSFKKYTIAISTTGEYTAFFGGTKEKAINSIVTLLNRINFIFFRDLGVELTLASGNDSIIFTDPQNDPFENKQTDMGINATVQQNALNLNKLGSFDVGHILATKGGGIAVLGALGTANRSKGMTGLSNPTGDSFFVDYVAHELGHQFGADHSFNGTSGSCGAGSRSPSQAWEPGSGSTIMAYAGLCGEENIQNNSEPYFHSKSIEQIKSHLALYPNTGLTINYFNSPPIVNAGDNYAIPPFTPFTLKGSGEDIDNDKLSYTWEQVDLGNPSFSELTMTDDGSRPIFRFIAPSDLPIRTIPAMKSLLKGTLDKGEAWPELDRNITLRLTARDNNGNINTDEMTISIISNARFNINPVEQNTIFSGQSNTITWNMSGTNKNPINCFDVDISISNDDGGTWKTINEKQPNNGYALVNIPVNMIGPARLMISCKNNIFFSISPVLSVIKGDTGILSSNTNENSTVSSNSLGGGGTLHWTSIIFLIITLCLHEKCILLQQLKNRSPSKSRRTFIYRTKILHIFQQSIKY